MNIADRGLAPLSVALGLWQSVEGGRQLLGQGHRVEGALNVLGGLSGASGGLAGTAAAWGAGGVSAQTVLSVGSVSAGLGTWSGVGLGVAAMAYGVKTVYEGVRQKDGFKEAGGAIKTVGGGMIVGGACTGNLPLVAAGAGAYVVGLGVEHGREIGHLVEEGVDAAEETVQQAMRHLW